MTCWNVSVESDLQQSVDKIQIGDQVLKLNNTLVQDSDHFFRLLRFAPPCATITLIRDEKKAAEIEAKVLIPPDRAKLITRRDGYMYFVSFTYSHDYLIGTV